MSHENTEEKKPFIPPHIAWPGLVVALLLVSVGSNVGLVIASQTDNGAQPEEGYYERALEWDNIQAARASAKKYAWTTNFAPGEQGMTITVSAKSGEAPVELKNAKVTYQHNAVATRHEVELSPSADAPLTHVSAGLWNFAIRGEIDGTPVLHEFRQEWKRAGDM